MVPLPCIAVSRAPVAEWGWRASRCSARRQDTPKLSRVPTSRQFGIGSVRDLRVRERKDRKSTRLTPVTNAHLVCRLLLEKKTKNNTTQTILDSIGCII